MVTVPLREIIAILRRTIARCGTEPRLIDTAQELLDEIEHQALRPADPLAGQPIIGTRRHLSVIRGGLAS